MNLFLDSAFLIALINDNDDLHEKSLEIVDVVLNNKCYITNLIINEVVTVIGNKVNLKTALKAYDILMKTCILLNEYEVPNFNNETMKFYEKYNTNLSFTDCSILRICKLFNIDYLVTFDKYFKKVDEVTLFNRI